MGDIRVSTEWRTHPKRRKLQRRLGADGVLAIETLWLWAAENRPDGELRAMDAEDIAIAAEYPGEPEELVETLSSEGIRLLDRGDEWWELHDWEDHQPWVVRAPERRETAKRNAAIRWHKEGRHTSPSPGCPMCETDASGMPPASDTDTEGMPPACDGASDGNAPTPVPSPVPDPVPSTPPKPPHGGAEKPPADKRRKGRRKAPADPSRRFFRFWENVWRTHPSHKAAGGSGPGDRAYAWETWWKLGWDREDVPVEDLERLARAARNNLEDLQNQDPPGSTPHLSTWLNRGTWEEWAEREPRPPARARPSPRRGGNVRANLLHDSMEVTDGD